MESSEALVAVEPVDSVLPVFSGRQMGQALTAYKELQRALDDGMPECIMEIQGRKFRKKSYWRAVATAFKLNVECIREDRQQTNGTFVYVATYRATTPSGRTADGDGACSSAEKAGRQATEHNVRSHAHTRAFNRAVSNIVGFGEVSAEEVNEEGEVLAHSTPAVTVVEMPRAPVTAPPKAPPTPGLPVLRVKEVQKRTGKSGKEYYEVYFQSKLGNTDKDMATTFDEDVVEVAIQAIHQRRKVQAKVFQKENGYWNIAKNGLTLVDED